MEHREFRIRIPWPTIRLSQAWRRWLPTPGNIVFTVLIVAMFFVAQSAGALPLGRPQAAPAAPSTGTIAYQGRLADAAGQPLTGTYNMIFRLYTVATGGTPLWTEQWTGSNGVRVSDGLFNVMLGSLTTLPQSAIAGRSQLFLGITVGTDDEMAPRVQLGSVPFAVQALTVPDGSITAAKLAPSVFQVYTARNTTDYWVMPACRGNHSNDTDYYIIPGLSISITVERSLTALVDFTGLGQNPSPSKAIYSNIFVDGQRTSTPSGQTLLSGCRNDPADAGGGYNWCSLTNTTAISLAPGQHVIDARVWCDGDLPANVHSGILRVLVLP